MKKIGLIVSMVAVILSGIALYFAKQSNDIAQEIFLLQNIPSIDIDLAYAENGVDVIDFKFISTNALIIIQSAELFAASNATGEQLIEQCYKGVCRTHKLINRISQIEQVEWGPDEPELYPYLKEDDFFFIGSKVSLLKFGQLEVVELILKLNYTSFPNKTKLILRSIEVIEQQNVGMQTTSDDEFLSRLKTINCRDGVEKYSCLSEELVLNEFFTKDSPHFSLANLLLHILTKEKLSFNCNEDGDSLSFLIPRYLINDAAFQNFNNFLMRVEADQNNLENKNIQSLIGKLKRIVESAEQSSNGLKKDEMLVCRISRSDIADVEAGAGLVWEDLLEALLND